jgi:hypothetical protein
MEEKFQLHRGILKLLLFRARSKHLDLYIPAPGMRSRECKPCLLPVPHNEEIKEIEHKKMS